MQRLRTRRPSRSSQFQGMLMLGIVMAAMSGAAQIPGIISYQGKLANEGADLEGTYAFKFAFVGAAGDITYWSHDNTGANGTEPVGQAIQLPVIRGVFAVDLGDVTVSNMMVSIPASVFTNEEVFLRIWIDDGVNGFQRLNPDSRMGSVGYALAAAKLVGPIAETQLPSNVARLSAKQTFTGINTFAGPTRLTNRFNVLVGRHLGDGSGLTNIRASSIVGMSLLGGGVGDNRRTPAFLEPDQVFTGSNIFTGVVRLTNPNNRLAGDGTGLTNLNAANIVGPLPEFALPQGLMIASIHPRDSRLLTNGFRRVASMRSPAWQDGSSSHAPSARFAHTAVWDGQRMIVWGGRIGIGTVAINSGAIYYPESDQWETLSSISAPSPRWGHTAVWSGKEMLVWGGNGSGGCLNTGGRMNPGQQAWKSISTRGAPSARQGHIAEWTGSRMLIWGGRNPARLLNDGALYDPETDQWSELNLPDPPQERTGAVALWAWNRVLIWGGEGYTGYLKNGSQLLFSGVNPVEWVPISLTGAPVARRAYSAVWTGEKVLVWGGESGGNELRDGAAYDPVSNRWEPLPETNAPVARFAHVAVWTGDLMLVLGGTTGGTELSTGWAFDPAGGSWWPLSNSGNPQVRAEATACWTGTEVLVFGGRANGKLLASLQRLAPEPPWHFYRKM